MPVFPKEFAFFLVFGKSRINIFVVADKGEDFFHAFIEKHFVVAVDLHDDDGNGVTLVPGGFSFIFNGLYVFDIKFLKGGNTYVVALVAYSVP